MSLAGRKIVIVGGTSGMGRAVAELALEHGAAVVIVGRDPQKAETTAAQVGPGVTGLSCDLTDPTSIDALAQRIGSLDHLVLSAASLNYGPFLELSPADAHATMDSKFWGYYLTTRALAPQLAADGSITFFSGVAAVRPEKGSVMVTAVNAAIEGLTRSLAIELAPRRVNAVSPGIVETPSWAHLSEDERTQMFEQLSSSLPAGRVGQPDDIARAVLELIGNGYSTGDVRNVDGGARLV